MSQTLLLVDLPNLARKAFHIHGGRFTGADGRPTGTAYGVLSSTLAIARVAGATHVAGAIEAGGSAARRVIEPTYKAHRKAAPEGFFAEMEVAIDAYAAMGWPVYRSSGYEADDTLATVARVAIDAGLARVEIASADRDLFGAVRTNVGVLWTGAPTSEIDRHRIDPAAVRERIGVEPNAVADYKALAGDSSDGYGGVRGIGPETAAALIRAHGSLDALYGALDQVEPPRLRARLVAGEESARRSLAVARLHDDVPLEPPFAFPAGRLAPLDRPRAVAFLQTAAMGSLLRRLPGADDVDG